MAKRRPYPSDLSDARWELVEPVLARWCFERRGRALDFGWPPEHDLRDMMDAILDRTGDQWRYLPHDFPHWNTVYGYFAAGSRKACRPAQRPQAALTAEGRTGGRTVGLRDRRAERENLH
ncbi:transposase [Streptomyces sp. NPDC055109]